MFKSLQQQLQSDGFGIKYHQSYTMDNSFQRSRVLEEYLKSLLQSMSSTHHSSQNGSLSSPVYISKYKNVFMYLCGNESYINVIVLTAIGRAAYAYECLNKFAPAEKWLRGHGTAPSQKIHVSTASKCL